MQRGHLEKFDLIAVPVCQWLQETSFAQGREVQGVGLLVQPARLHVQVLKDVHFSLQANLK